MARKKKQRPKKQRQKKHYVLRLVIIIAILVGIGLLMHIDYFNVKGIAVIGNEEISDEEIMHLSGVQVGKSIFDVHPILVQHRIKNNLYIEDVNVDRKLPDTVEIKVQERKGNAQIKKGNKYVIIANDGTVIEVSDTEKKATTIEGISVIEAEKNKQVKVKEEDVFQSALKLVKAMDENDLFFKKIVIDGNKVYAYVFDELVCVGKYNNMMDSIESGTLKSVIYDLYQKGTEKGTINVYDNDYCFFTP